MRLAAGCAYVSTKELLAVTAMIKTILAKEITQAAHKHWQTIADVLCDRAPNLAE